MTRNSANRRQYRLTVTFEIEEGPLALTCKLANKDQLVDEFTDYFSDNEVGREQLRYRIDYLSSHLETYLHSAIAAFFNESALATPKSDLKTVKTQRATLKRWRAPGKDVDLGDGWTILAHPHLVSSDAETRLRIAREHGGARSIEKTLETKKECSAFARVVDDLHPAWTAVTKHSRHLEYDYTTIQRLKEKEFFKELSKTHPVPDDLLEKACKRKSRRTKDEDHYPPFRLALEHAFREIYPQKKVPKYSTLRARYTKGKN
jgi:hypothetical protein